MHRTQDLALARLRLVAQRWRVGSVAARGLPTPGHRTGGQTFAGADPAPAHSLDDEASGPATTESHGSGHQEAAGDRWRQPHPDQAWPPWGMWVRLVGVLCALGLLGALVALLVAWPRQRAPILAPSPVSAAHPTAIPSPTAGDPFVDDPFAGDPPAGVPLPAGMSPGAPAPASAVPWLEVHVAGDVRRPGIVRLPAGSRVHNAVEAAGGLRRGADVGPTNLARLLADGERIEVGSDAVPVSGSGVAAPPEGAVPTDPATPVDLNTATLAQLDALPGVGPVTAAKILDWRGTNGRFTTVEELTEISGIGPLTLAELRPHVRV